MSINSFTCWHLLSARGTEPLAIDIHRFVPLVSRIRVGGGATKWENHGSETFL